MASRDAGAACERRGREGAAGVSSQALLVPEGRSGGEGGQVSGVRVHTLCIYLRTVYAHYTYTHIVIYAHRACTYIYAHCV